MLVRVCEWQAYLNGFAAGYWPCRQLEHSVEHLRNASFTSRPGVRRASLLCTAACAAPAPEVLLPSLPSLRSSGGASNDPLHTMVHAPNDGNIFAEGNDPFGPPPGHRLPAELPCFPYRRSDSVPASAVPALAVEELPGRAGLSDPGVEAVLLSECQAKGAEDALASLDLALLSPTSSRGLSSLSEFHELMQHLKGMWSPREWEHVSK